MLLWLLRFSVRQTGSELPNRLRVRQRALTEDVNSGVAGNEANRVTAITMAASGS